MKFKGKLRAEQAWREQLIIAQIDEKKIGGGGGVFMMVITILACTALILLDTSAIRQAVWGTMMTAGCIFWGVIALLDRKSQYTVYRRPTEKDHMPSS